MQCYVDYFIVQLAVFIECFKIEMIIFFKRSNDRLTQSQSAPSSFAYNVEFAAVFLTILGIRIINGNDSHYYFVIAKESAQSF